jgi:phosphate transport system substrate-binding protein
MRWAGWAAVAVALLPTLTGCSHRGTTTTDGKVHLRGSGSSFVKPVMDKWIAVYTSQGGDINYQSVGSGTGVDNMIDRSVNFGATDAILTAVQEKKAAEAKNGGDVLHIPLVMGGIVPAFNLDGVEKLNFTGEILAEIYMGKLTRWNDPKLVAVNDGVTLPDKEIAVVARSDSSGSTNIFTDFLSKVHPEFKAKVGVGNKVTWRPADAPRQVTGEGNTAGVAAFVKKTANSIGYIELTYALQNKIAYGAVKNQEGEFIRADLKSVSKAAENSLANIPDDLRFSITDAPGKGSYPISGTTWAVVFAKQTSADKAKQLGEFFTWVIHDGQKYAEDLDYAPLPPGLVKKTEAVLKKITAQ